MKEVDPKKMIKMRITEETVEMIEMTGVNVIETTSLI